MMYQDKVFVDSCSFDSALNPENKAAHLIHNLRKQKVIDIQFVHSKEKEDRYTRMPDWVVDEALSDAREKPELLEGEEKVLLENIESLLKVHSANGVVAQDAQHIWDCHKSGIYFVTTDEVILKCRDDLMELCSVIVCLPSDFLNRLEKIIKSEFFMFSIKSEERVYTSYCGLYCRDCIPANDRMYPLVRKLKILMEELQFDKYAEAISSKNAIFGSYHIFSDMLDALESLETCDTCKRGGCNPGCFVRECAVNRNYEGCWMCSQYKSCELLEELKKLHPGIEYNIDIIKEEGLANWTRKKKKHYRWE